MIQKLTKLHVSDNSGGKICQCIGLYKNRKSAKVGDIILVSIKSINKNNKLNAKVKKGEKYKAIVIRSAAKYKRGADYFSFGQNAVVLLNASMKTIGNRVSGVGIRIKNATEIYKSSINLIEKAI